MATAVCFADMGRNVFGIPVAEAEMVYNIFHRKDRRLAGQRCQLLLVCRAKVGYFYTFFRKAIFALDDHWGDN